MANAPIQVKLATPHPHGVTPKMVQEALNRQEFVEEVAGALGKSDEAAVAFKCDIHGCPGHRSEALKKGPTQK